MCAVCKGFHGGRAGIEEDGWVARLEFGTGVRCQYSSRSCRNQAIKPSGSMATSSRRDCRLTGSRSG